MSKVGDSNIVPFGTAPIWPPIEWANDDPLNPQFNLGDIVETFRRTFPTVEKVIGRYFKTSCECGDGKGGHYDKWIYTIEDDRSVRSAMYGDGLRLISNAQTPKYSPDEIREKFVDSEPIWGCS